MSLYYEFKSCCVSKHDHKEDHDHEQDCFCGKGIKQFLGRNVTIYTNGVLFTSGNISCFDKKTGILTLVRGDNFISYICCEDISSIRDYTAAPGDEGEYF